VVRLGVAVIPRLPSTVAAAAPYADPAARRTGVRSAPRFAGSLPPL